MDPARNPYSPGAGLRPPELAGREKQVNDFAVLRRRVANGLSSRSIVMAGLRGVGKTVLLNELADAARGDGWIVAKVEGDRGEGRFTFRQKVARSLNRSLREATGGEGVVGALRRTMATFKAFSLHTDPSGALAVGIEIDPERGRGDTGMLEVDLGDLALDLAGGARELGVGAALLVDELQDLETDELAALCLACHEVGQRDAHFYVVGAGLPSLPGMLAEARSYAERLFDYWSIGALDSDAATVALERPAAAAGVAWDERAVRTVVDASGGYPYFIQEFGKAAWDVAPAGRITERDALMAVRVGTDSLDRGFFTSRWERATPSERAYMRAMASDGDLPSQSGQVAARLGKAASSVGPVRANLIAKSLVYPPEHGLIAFTVPGMAEFIGRQPEE